MGEGVVALGGYYGRFRKAERPRESRGLGKVGVWNKISFVRPKLWAAHGKDLSVLFCFRFC